jgi:hypothetical protein
VCGLLNEPRTNSSLSVRMTALALTTDTADSLMDTHLVNRWITSLKDIIKCCSYCWHPRMTLPVKFIFLFLWPIFRIVCLDATGVTIWVVKRECNREQDLEDKQPKIKIKLPAYVSLPLRSVAFTNLWLRDMTDLSSRTCPGWSDISLEPSKFEIVSNRDRHAANQNH